MYLKTLLILAVMFLSISLADAEIYKWIDENGAVTFKDTPPPATKKRRKVKVYGDSDFSAAPSRQPESATHGNGKSEMPVSPSLPPKKERFAGTVEIYVTDWCGYCRKALDYMNRKGIAYTAYNIEKDSAAKRRYDELGGHGVPLIIIGTNRMAGFSPETLEYYLDNSR